LTALDLVKLGTLMARTSGHPNVKIGLIDGPVAARHPDLSSESIRYVRKTRGGTCVDAHSFACQHATFIAGILCAKRNSPAPAICPDCILLVLPIFAETISGRENIPGAKPLALAAAIIDCIDDGAQIINLSLGLATTSTQGEQVLEQAVDYAARRGVIVVAAVGNQGIVGNSAIALHPWLIPIVGCDLRGHPMRESNLGRSIGIRGLSAPGEGVVSLGFENQAFTLRGTSVAVPFVTGAIALLWSEFPSATAAQIRLALTQAPTPGRASIVPPLLDAEAAYQRLLAAKGRGRAA
jgi:subtilisin family serine protease